MAVRLPKDFALPEGEVFIEEREGEIVIFRKRKDLKELFPPIPAWEIPERPQDNRKIEW